MAGKFSIRAIFSAKDRTGAIIAKISTRLERMTRVASSGLRKLDERISALHGGLKTAALAGVAAGGAFGFAAHNVISAGADFEEAISAVGAVSLMTRDQIADLEKKAIELGATTKFSATEVANGMELMGKAGFTNAEILQGIGGVLAAAAADGAELAETAGHISNVLKGMGLATTEATRVADVLTLASARTNSSISSLGESMANVSSTARQFKIPLEDTVAAVALLQDVGLDASEAGSAVNTMLTKMAAPSKEVRKQMKKMGISFQDAQGNMLPLGDVMAQLAKSAEKSGGNMEQVAFFADLVGLRGQKAAANLKDMFLSGKAGALTDELRNAAGSAEKMARLRLNNLKGDVEELGGAFDSLKIALFNTQSGPLRGLVQGMTKWLEQNNKLIVSKVTDYVKEFKDHLPEIWMWTKRIAIGIAVFYGIAAAVKVARVAVAAFELTMAAAALAGRAFNGAVLLSRLAIVSFATSTTVATVAQRAWGAALLIGKIATTPFTLATIASTVATVANTVATKARTVAQLAFNVGARAAAWLVALYTAATNAGTLADKASAIATWAKNAAVAAYNLVLGVGRGAVAAYTAAVSAGTATTAAFAATVMAAVAALGALYLAWQQNEQLKSETGGLGVFDIAAGMIDKGTFNPFDVVDEHMNKQARAKAAQQKQVVGPEESVAKSISETTSRADLFVHAEKGTGTRLEQPKKTPGARIKLASTGAF
jgi:TP901 family phage tail tape measure protein